MSYEPSGLLGHHLGEIDRTMSSHGATGNSFSPASIVNGGHALRPIEGEKKRNYKLLIDPVLKGRGHQKIYRFDGDFEGAPVIPKDPRSRRTRLWSTRTKADLPVPKFKIDKFYVGIPPQRDVILNGLNDNVDRKFLTEICEKFGNIEGVKIFYDTLTKRHLGKARVGFSTSASAKLAVAKLDGTSIMGCIVHADFEHRVEIKVPNKPDEPSQQPDITHTPPPVDKIPALIHHVLPTPPPSASSQSPANSTPSTPGSVGLIDPRTRGLSTSSATTEKFRSTSPAWPQLNPVQQPTKATQKIAVFEPISPPCERVKLPPPPPPEAPPPPLPGKSPSSTGASSGKAKHSLGDKYRNVHHAYSSKDTKSQESSRSSRDSYKSSRQEKDSDWRRRDRTSSRDRHDGHSSYRSRWSSEDGRRGTYSSYQDKESRYSSYKEYSSRGRSDSSRDGSGRSESRRSSYSRDNDSRRSRDSDSSCSSTSEKSESNRKSKYERTSSNTRENMEKENDKGNLDSSEKPIGNAGAAGSDVKMGLDVDQDNLNQTQYDFLSSSLSATVTLPSTLENSIPSTENENSLSWDTFADQMLELNRATKDKELQMTSQRDDNYADFVGNLPKVPQEEFVQDETSEGIATPPVSQAVSDLPPPKAETKSAPKNLSDIAYQPIYEDISPVSSPIKTKRSPCSYPVTQTAVTSDSVPEVSEDMVIDKDNEGTTEDNDDAMSLSSISSNEETFEVTEPKRVPITVPPPAIPFPFVPSVLPPFMPCFDPTVPPPSITAMSMLPPLPITVPPPSIPPPHPNLTHPLVPPSYHPVFPPQFVPASVPQMPMQQPYQVYPSGHLPSPCDQQRPQKKTWKAKISEEVLNIVSKELQLILKRDVTKRLVENSAFKALDGWWDNLGKTKLKTATQPEPTTTTSQPSILSSTSTPSDMTSSPFFLTSMNQAGVIGLRASLPKMPSFRKRQQPSGSELYSKHKREDLSVELGRKTESDSEASGPYDSEGVSLAKRVRNDDQLINGDNAASPWQTSEDGIDGPPATSVRTEEKHPTVGSSLYTNIYSSLSESGSSLSGDESDSSRDDQSDWDESDESSSESEYSSDEEDDTKHLSEEEDETKQTKELTGISRTPPGIPRTPPGTPPETPPATPPRVPRTPSITPPPSPGDSQILIVDEFVEKETVVENGKPEDTEEHSGLSEVTQDNLVTTDSTEYTSESIKSGGEQVLSSIIRDDEEQLRIETDKEDTLNDISHKELKEHTETEQQSVSEESTTPLEPGTISIQPLQQPIQLKSPLSENVADEPLVDVTKETEADVDYKSLFELRPEFPVRPYWQDDQLVYNFLVTGLDYEDAAYLKVGFENLVQVGSDSIANAHWSYHPTTSAGVLTKGRKQKSDSCGVRLHSSGTARCEGYYKIGMNEKAKYLEAARRQVDKTQVVDNKKTEEKEANKAKQQSRENRALQRRLAASFQNEDFGDIVKFNQLKVRKKKLTFCKSRIHDWGLFALEPIGPDEMVIEYVGEVVRQAIADDREKRYERLGIGSSYLFRVDSDTILDATKYGNLARFINHCCEDLAENHYGDAAILIKYKDNNKYSPTVTPKWSL